MDLRAPAMTFLTVLVLRRVTDQWYTKTWTIDGDEFIGVWGFHAFLLRTQ